jgi:hypothetical protein
MVAPDELNERQQELVSQVASGGVTEDLTDTESQLLRLAQLGHLHADYKDGEWSFTTAGEPAPEPEPEPDTPEE